MMPSEVLRAALDGLVETGWTRLYFVDRDGRRCMSKALSDAANEPLSYLRARQALVAAVDPDGTMKSSSPIVSFNDRLGRTFGEVVDAFEKAIKAAEKCEAS